MQQKAVRSRVLQRHHKHKLGRKHTKHYRYKATLTGLHSESFLETTVVFQHLTRPFNFTPLILLIFQLNQYATPPVNCVCTTSFLLVQNHLCAGRGGCAFCTCNLPCAVFSVHVRSCVCVFKESWEGTRCNTITCSHTLETVCIRLPQGQWLLILWHRSKTLYSELHSICIYMPCYDSRIR